MYITTTLVDTSHQSYNRGDTRMKSAREVMDMGRPTRQHPALNIIAESTQGRVFGHWLYYFFGDDMEYQPLAKVRDDWHVFDLESKNVRGTYIEREQIKGEIVVYECAFRAELEPVGLVAQVALLAHRWDAWIYASATGDQSFAEMTTARRRRITDQKSAELGQSRDRVSAEVLPRDMAPSQLLGLTLTDFAEARREFLAREERRARRLARAGVVDGTPSE